MNAKKGTLSIVMIFFMAIFFMYLIFSAGYKRGQLDTARGIQHYTATTEPSYEWREK